MDVLLRVYLIEKRGILMITCPASREGDNPVLGDSNRANGSSVVRLVELKLLCLILIALFAPGCGGDKGASPKPAPFVHFVPNSHAFWSNPDNWTTDFGPAYANILLDGSNFLPCRGGPFALCYYSGPSTGSEDLSCTLTPDGQYANCKCFNIPYGAYFVDINGILNHSVYENTVAQCGSDGSLWGRSTQRRFVSRLTREP